MANRQFSQMVLLGLQKRGKSIAVISEASQLSVEKLQSVALGKGRFTDAELATIESVAQIDAGQLALGMCKDPEPEFVDLINSISSLRKTPSPQKALQHS